LPAAVAPCPDFAGFRARFFTLVNATSAPDAIVNLSLYLPLFGLFLLASLTHNFPLILTIVKEYKNNWFQVRTTGSTTFGPFAPQAMSAAAPTAAAAAAAAASAADSGMIKFVVFVKNSIDSDDDSVDKDVERLIQPSTLTAATTAAAGMAFTVNSKEGRRQVYSVTDRAALYASLYEKPKKDKLGNLDLPLTTFQFLAKDELDAYYRLVMNDCEFNLKCFIDGWKDYRTNLTPPRAAASAAYANNNVPYISPEGVLLEHVFGQLSSQTQQNLLENKEEGRDWITLALAKQMWLIYNDPFPRMAVKGDYGSSLSFNNAIPHHHLRHACLILMEITILLPPIKIMYPVLHVACAVAATYAKALRCHQIKWRQQLLLNQHRTPTLLPTQFPSNLIIIINDFFLLYFFVVLFFKG
jgi:hypothetical protein